VDIPIEQGGLLWRNLCKNS